MLRGTTHIPITSVIDTHSTRYVRYTSQTTEVFRSPAKLPWEIQLRKGRKAAYSRWLPLSVRITKSTVHDPSFSHEVYYNRANLQRQGIFLKFL